MSLNTVKASKDSEMNTIKKLFLKGFKLKCDSDNMLDYCCSKADACPTHMLVELLVEFKFYLDNTVLFPSTPVQVTSVSEISLRSELKRYP